jgi:hypothetical protein
MGTSALDANLDLMLINYNTSMLNDLPEDLRKLYTK